MSDLPMSDQFECLALRPIITKRQRATQERVPGTRGVWERKLIGWELVFEGHVPGDHHLRPAIDVVKAGVIWTAVNYNGTEVYGFGETIEKAARSGIANKYRERAEGIMAFRKSEQDKVEKMAAAAEKARKAAELKEAKAALFGEVLAALTALYEAMPAPSSRKVTEQWDKARLTISKASALEHNDLL